MAAMSRFRSTTDIRTMYAMYSTTAKAGAPTMIESNDASPTHSRNVVSSAS